MGRLRLRRPRTGNLVMLGLIAVALFAGMFLVFQTIEAERAERQQVRETSEILLELRNVTRAALNGETGQRGYLLTLDRRYLEPYHVGREQYRPALQRLRRLVGADAPQRQQELLDEIQALAESKFAEMEEVVALVDERQVIEARRRLLDDEGAEAMARLRRATREMELIENRILLNAASETARAEGRVLPLLAGVVLILLVTLVLGYRLVTRTAHAEAEAAQATALGEARDRADLLARELNHRVKNLFAVILAIIRMSAKDSPEAKPVIDRITERIHALLTAHDVSQGTLERPVASLRTLVETTLAPYRSEKLAAKVDGDEIELPAKQVTPLGLVLHELTTNAVKYGAWSKGGLLEVTWREADGQVTIEWREHCEGDGKPPERTGFGSLLMTSAARQLRGEIDRRFGTDGVEVTIAFPLGA
ncbi:Signal transduction histidine kinase [Pelagerythrobacter marensis]|uniref:histidine kinase n=2 Tax=Pelagerythrobacter marensis TaxID=543877 RepID=A0A0G3XCH6_9SPHN|nr:Signal transduction histidine kinase [Pelagerythrobacter marensis]